MAIEQTEVQALPFVIEPIAPARIKLWAKFAAQMSSDVDISIASDVYFGLWFDNHAFRMYDHTLMYVEWAAAGDPSSVASLVMWLDEVATSLKNVVRTWSYVTRGLLGEVGDVSFPRHYKDAEQHVGAAVRLLAEVRQFGVAVCQEFGLVIPSNFIEQSHSPAAGTVGEEVERL